MTRRLSVFPAGALWVALLFCSASFAPAQTDPCTQSGQANIDQCAWNTFASLLSSSTWTTWSSTADLLDQANPGASGSRYIPPACAALHTQNPTLAVIDQVGKVNDSVFEAGDTGKTRTYTWSGSNERSNGVGLSGDPVVAASGSFLRYQILLSPSTYNWIVSQNLYKASTLESWNGDIVFPDGSTVVKNAWMELGGLPSDKFFTQDFLVYTPPSLLQSAGDTCEKQTLALVGQHLVTKTSANPGWTWATLEHVYAAPDCTGSLPTGASGGINVTCPDSSAKTSQLSGTGFSSFLLNPTDCSTGACASCNTKPSFNCEPGTSGNDTSYCVDASPNAQSGTSQLCRQVAPSLYRSAAGESQSTLSDGNYMLISTQWYPNGGSGDINNAPTVRDNANRGNIQPSSTTRGTATEPASVLGNSTMESYERSNCMGCHSSSVFVQSSGTQISTDYMYWLTIEVPCGANGDPSVCPSAPAPVPASHLLTKRSSTGE